MAFRSLVIRGGPHLPSGGAKGLVKSKGGFTQVKTALSKDGVFTCRSAFRSQGTQIKLVTNYYEIGVDGDYFCKWQHYGITITELVGSVDQPRDPQLRTIMELAIKQLFPNGVSFASDFKSNVLFNRRLEGSELGQCVVSIEQPGGRSSRQYKVKFKNDKDIDLGPLFNVLKSMDIATDANPFTQFAEKLNPAALILDHQVRKNVNIHSFKSGKFFNINLPGDSEGIQDLGQRSMLTVNRGFFQSTQPDLSDVIKLRNLACMHNFIHMKPYECTTYLKQSKVLDHQLCKVKVIYTFPFSTGTIAKSILGPANVSFHISASEKHTPAMKQHLASYQDGHITVAEYYQRRK
ncbi:hypothetical protein TruAng_007791 [Truncatella angustata]|nr:hypothetical protein TruAng_007791 [Truncatella angustata]